jgi:predicted HTH transcriptional regulator
MFTVILRRPVDFSQWINQWHDELSSNRIKILEELYKNNTISKEELGEAVGLSKTAIDNNIKWLRNNDFLNRIGSDRGGKWQVLFKNKMGR